MCNGEYIVQGYAQKICLKSAILDFPGRNLQLTAEFSLNLTLSKHISGNKTEYEGRLLSPLMVGLRFIFTQYVPEADVHDGLVHPLENVLKAGHFTPEILGCLEIIISRGTVLILDGNPEIGVHIMSNSVI